MRKRGFFGFIVFCAGLTAATGTASAAALSFQGVFNTDDQLEIFSFVASSPTAVLRTWGFAGGLNANGDTVLDGGFDPVLSLFGPGLLQASTPLLVTNNDGGASVPPDPGTGEFFDSFIDTSMAPTIVSLTAGQTYFLVLTEFDNIPLGTTYGEGFTEQGTGDFTSSLYSCGSPAFCDSDFLPRNGHWAVDISGVDSATDLSANSATPEPGSFWLLGAALAGILAVGRRSRLAPEGQSN